MSNPTDEPAAAPTRKDKHVAALLREREGYVARDLKDRIEQVDKQLAAFGHKVEDSVRRRAPRGRSGSAPKSTTSADGGQGGAGGDAGDGSGSTA